MLLPVRHFLLTAACALPTWALAQVNPEARVAARDSVLLKARSIRLALDQQTTISAARTPRLGVRRIVTRGYMIWVVPPNSPGGQPGATKKQLLWKRVNRIRRSGATVDKLWAYSDELPVLKEIRINNQTRYLEVRWYKFQPYITSPQAKYLGVLTNTGYVRWKDQKYTQPFGNTGYDGL